MIVSPDITEILKTARSDAERRVARLLHGIVGDADAVAFHSVKLRSHPEKQQAEADFIILWSGVLIVVEVKGGGVRKVDGKWWTVDRRNEWKRLRESPMDQAASAMFALREILREDGIGWYADQHAVMTPDVDDLSTAIGWHSSHWLAQNEMTVDAMTHALDAIASRAASPRLGFRRASVADLRSRLFGEFSRMPSIDAQRGAVIEEQNRATEGQARYLEGLYRNPRVLVTGGAGTGKSLALAEGAKQEADQGRSILITFRSPGLLDYFTTLIGEREIDVVPFGELKVDRRYDSVYIDEAQDLMNADDMDVFDQLVVGGRANGRWRMFLDRNNQAHVDGGFDEDAFELVLEEAVLFELPVNVRNTKPIVQAVQEYLAADIGDPGIVHGEPLHWHPSDGLASVDFAEKVAEELISDGAHPGSIWIIDVSASEPPFVTKRGVTITSPRYAKGLEADRVIVCSLPTSFDQAGAAAFYVAATRARVALHIAVSKEDTARLKSLLRERMRAR